ncbi:MAG: LysR family transcriptional regulator [Desulfobacterales bacterium]|nr:LysR family transcriptional regulator [Desulfobacterales bacterium]
MKNTSLEIRSKIWIQDDSGKIIFGLGRLKMLESIERTGSIQGAAKELGMSYQAVWGRIKATEERLGESLLIRNIGGVQRGGSELTPFAKKLIHQFQELHERIAQDSNELFETVFNSEE